MACCVQPALCADTRLWHIALPVAHEALLLAYGNQSAYNASPASSLLQCSRLQAPSCLQQKLHPIQRGCQRLTCKN